MREESKDSFVKWFTMILVVAIFAGGLMFAWPAYLSSKNLHRKEAELDRLIKEKRAEIAATVENQKRFMSDRDFVEKIARQNRRVFPGEIVFVFDEGK